MRCSLGRGPLPEKGAKAPARGRVEERSPSFERGDGGVLETRGHVAGGQRAEQCGAAGRGDPWADPWT